MKTYSVTICHIAYATVDVEAESEDQAAELVWDQWDGDADDCDSNDISDIAETEDFTHE